MVEIDGSYGEGGGQVPRTSLALAAVLGRELRVRSIRAGRPKPGMAAQHLAGVLAAAEVCGARVEGATTGSTELVFEPGRIRGGSYRWEVGTAGSVCLVAQTVLPPLLFAPRPSFVEITGGTNVPWSPSFEYLDRVFLPALRLMGAEVHATRLRPGFYPKGGGAVHLEVLPLAEPLRPLDWRERGELRGLEAISLVEARLAKHIINRQLAAAQKALGATGVRATRDHAEALSPGTMLLLAASFQHGAAGFTALGERGKPAEKVGEEAGRACASFLAGSASVDEHLADQLALYAALAQGRTGCVTERVTEHLRTNLWVIGQFLEAPMSCDAESGAVEIEGVGLLPAGGE